MINEYCAEKFCCEDLSLIENYELAINDTTQIWHCHHKLGEQFSRKYLKEHNLYENRPACELKFMTESEHRSLHCKGKNNPMFGKPGSFKGRRHTEEAKKKNSDAHKKENLSEETIKKYSDNAKERNTGRRWFNDGQIEVFQVICPDGFIEGRLICPHLAKHHSEKTKKTLSMLKQGCHWWNNGIVTRLSKECPGPDWKRGRL